MADAINEIINKIKLSETVYIAGHLNPDGDAVGSCFALAEILKVFGKKPVVLLETFSDKFDIIADNQHLFNGSLNDLPQRPELFIALDTSVKDRLGMFEQVFDNAAFTINIDHHVSNTNYADINYVESKSSSTCETVYSVFSSYSEINHNIAAPLYTGIITDTDGLRFPSVSPKTFEIVARLIETGINFPEIQRTVLHARSFAEARILGIALNNLRIASGGKIIYTTISISELTICGAMYSDLDKIAEHLLNIKGAEVSVLFSERGEDKVKASFRALNADVCSFASRYGGGGHKLAAGATLSGGIDSAAEEVISSLEEMINGI